MFYLVEAAEALNIKSYRALVQNYTAREIVSPELRRQHNIITYRRNGRRDDTITLLTEFGMYRLIMRSHSQKAEEFREFLYDLLHNLRMQGYNELRDTIDDQSNQIDKLDEHIIAQDEHIADQNRRLATQSQRLTEQNE
jgi:prophage antirepressor-like protein